MKSKIKKNSSAGFTLIELMIVICILGVMGSILLPQVELILVKAYQSKAKASLGVNRSALSLYYTKYDGINPLAPGPTSPYVNGTRASLSSVLVPEYVSRIDTPILKDGLLSFNTLDAGWDASVIYWMSQNPPMDVWIQDGPAQYTPLVNAPFIYDNIDGKIYICNGNYDSTGNYFYDW